MLPIEIIDKIIFYTDDLDLVISLGTKYIILQYLSYINVKQQREMFLPPWYWTFIREEYHRQFPVFPLTLTPGDFPTPETIKRLNQFEAACKV